MRTANWAMAADYVNKLFGAGARDPAGLVSFDTLIVNQPGCVEFKITRYALGANTFDRLVACVTAVHGKTFKTILGRGVRHEWALTPERSIVVGKREGMGVASGLYIQLKDTGN